MRGPVERIVAKTLTELARQYNLGNAVMLRLPRVIDRAALTAIMTGVQLCLPTTDAARALAQALADNTKDPAVTVSVRSDDLSDKHMLRIERMHHGTCARP